MKHIDSLASCSYRSQGQSAHRWQGPGQGPLGLSSWTTSRRTNWTEHRFVHEVVSKIKGGIIVKFVFLKEAREDKKALVLMTNALDMSVQDVYFHISGVGISRSITETASNAWEWASTR